MSKEEAKPAEAKKDGGGEKKSPGSKVWGGVGTFLSVMLGIIVFAMLAQALFPMAFSGVDGALGGIFSGITSIFSTVGFGISAIGNALGNMAGNLRAFMMGFAVFAITVLFIALGLILFKMGIDKIKNIGKDDGHH